ncbi:MAG: phosphotransferase [Actinomycetota bacterium]
MDQPLAVPPPPVDPDLPLAGALFRREPSGDLLERFLGRRGWHATDVRVLQALYRPGRALTVRFRVQAVSGSGAVRLLTVCLRTRARSVDVVAPSPEFGSRFGVSDPVEEIDGVTAWVFPYDPVLAGLPDAAHGPTVRDASDVRRPAAISVTPLRYRPGQRAAFRYTVAGLGRHRETLYGKVVGDDAFDRIFDAHRSYAKTGIRMVRPRVAEGLRGVALFPEIGGTCLRDLIESGGALPDPDRLVGLLERLARVRWLGAPDLGDAAASIRLSGRLLAHLRPHRYAEIRDAYHELAERAARPLAETFTVHGDLYEGQIFVDDEFSIGLIDLEDGGPGDPLMDAANMLAHLRVLHAYAPEAQGRPLAYRVMLRKALLEHLRGGGDEELAWREALCAMHLATGPFRVQAPDWPGETDKRIDEVLALLHRPAVAAA